MAQSSANRWVLLIHQIPLIRRFIDPEARFKFVAPEGYQPRAGELRFDMFEAEYTHEGEACTFETLVTRFGIGDAALRVIAQIVHDIDCKDPPSGRSPSMPAHPWLRPLRCSQRSMCSWGDQFGTNPFGPSAIDLRWSPLVKRRT